MGTRLQFSEGVQFWVTWYYSLFKWKDHKYEANRGWNLKWTRQNFDMPCYREGSQPVMVVSRAVAACCLMWFHPGLLDRVAKLYCQFVLLRSVDCSYWMSDILPGQDLGAPTVWVYIVFMVPTIWSLMRCGNPRLDVWGYACEDKGYRICRYIELVSGYRFVCSHTAFSRLRLWHIYLFILDASSVTRQRRAQGY